MNLVQELKNNKLEFDFSEWMNNCSSYKKDLQTVLPSYAKNPINSYYFIESLNKHSSNDCIFTNNYAVDSRGGGVRFKDIHGVELHNVQIIDNTSDYRGGGISFWNSTVLLDNVLIQGNETLESQGAGIAVYGESVVTVENSEITNADAMPFTPICVPKININGICIINEINAPLNTTWLFSAPRNSEAYIIETVLGIIAILKI